MVIRNMKIIDLTGQKINCLTVIKREGSDKNKHPRWLCRCKCGNEVIVAGSDLRQKRIKSCGCWRKERMSELNKAHGHRSEKIYNIWSRMKQRCINPKAPNYSNYGGRGIIVCQRWISSFEMFYEDVSKLAHFGEKGYSLNRIDNDGNYEPGNVEWSTQTEQANNRRTNHLISYNGETHTIAEWAKVKQIKKNTLLQRIYRGWPIEKALETP